MDIGVSGVHYATCLHHSVLNKQVFLTALISFLVLAHSKPHISFSVLLAILQKSLGKHFSRRPHLPS